MKADDQIIKNACKMILKGWFCPLDFDVHVVIPYFIFIRLFDRNDANWPTEKNN